MKRKARSPAGLSWGGGDGAPERSPRKPGEDLQRKARGHHLVEYGGHPQRLFRIILERPLVGGGGEAYHPVMSFSLDWPVTTDGSDSRGWMTPLFLCALLQETATLHANKLGWGYRDLEQRGWQWVLSRQWIQMDCYPRWQSTVRVETWPSTQGGITYGRDYRILDENAKVLGKGTSLWFVMDRKTRRPVRVDMGPSMVEDSEPPVHPSPLKPLRFGEMPSIQKAITTGHFDLDIHDHVNNVRYLGWMLDALNRDFLLAHDAVEFEINFLAEGHYGDSLESAVHQEDTESLHELRRGDEVLSRMRCQWTRREKQLVEA